jgi:hypothetical protein
MEGSTESCFIEVPPAVLTKGLPQQKLQVNCPEQRNFHKIGTQMSFVQSQICRKNINVQIFFFFFTDDPVI